MFDNGVQAPPLREKPKSFLHTGGRGVLQDGIRDQMIVGLIAHHKKRLGFLITEERRAWGYWNSVIGAKGEIENVLKWLEEER